jgi:hypothetical protein
MERPLWGGTRRNAELRRTLWLVMEYANNNGQDALEFIDNSDYIKLLAYGSGMNNLWDGKTTSSQRKKMREEFDNSIYPKLENDAHNREKDKQVVKVAAIQNKRKQLNNINKETEKYTTRQKRKKMSADAEAVINESSGSSSDMDKLIKSLKAADVGVLLGSGEYDKACDALKLAEKSCNKWLETQEDGPDVNKGVEEEKKLREDIKTSKERIQEYFNRKIKQGKMNENFELTAKADEKGVRRMSLMKEALELLNKMERNLDGKELHLPTDVQSPADMIAPTNAKHANKQLKLLVDRKGDELSRFEKRTAELGVASLVFEEMLKGSMGDEYRIKINDKEEFKSVIKKIANSDAIKKKFNKKKVTGDTVKEAITPENIKKIAKDITKEKEMTPEKLKPQAKVQMFK